MRNIYISLITILNFTVNYAQCNLAVTHSNGLATIGGINVNVSSDGQVPYYSSDYCPTQGYKYFIGNNNLGGSYSFGFSPPVSSLTLNIGGVSQFNNNNEEVHIFINGNQFPLNGLMNSNGCDILAILTTEGNITGCNQCPISSFNGITIQGIIYELKVEDVVISGNPNASLFGLFICNNSLSTINYSHKVGISTNPFSNFTTLITDKNMENATFEIFNSIGQIVKKMEHINGDTVTIYRENLIAGIYFIKLTEKNKILNSYKIIITDF
jgi:hypothetical protein